MTVAPTPMTVSSASLVAVAAGLAWTQLALDLGSRLAALKARPALLALHVGLALAVVLVAALVLRWLEGRRGGAGGRAPVWPVVLAFVGVAAVIGGRWAISIAEPTVAWLVPAMLVTPAALSYQLVALRRGGSQPREVALRQLATTWCAVAALGVMAVTLGPERWERVELRSIELVALAVSIVAVGAVTAAVASARWQRRGTLRLAIVAASGVATLGAAWLHDARDVLWPVRLAAAAVFVASVAPAAAVRRAAIAVPDWAPVVRGRAVGPARGALPVSSASLIVVAWELACVQAALDLGSRWAEVTARPALMAFDLGLLVAVVLVAALIARGVEPTRREARRPLWTIGLALVATVAVVGGRWAISLPDPTVAALVPALLVAPAVLSYQLFVMRRAGSRFDRGALRRFATTWCAASAVGLVAVALGPSRREGIDLQSTELLALALSVTAVAAATAVRDHEARMRFALVEVAGVAALGAVWLHDARDVIWPVHVAALAIFLAATVPALERPD